jgi:DNA-binding LytR/AlgR family response regulator
MINRKWLINIHHILRFKTSPKGKLLLELNPKPPEEVIFSQENGAAFKKWLKR